MNISDKLKELRGNANLSQEQVAEKIMVSRVTLSHWENGKSLPDIASLLSLSKLYNVSLDELVKGDSKMEEKLQADVNEWQALKRIKGYFLGMSIATGLIVYYLKKTNYANAK